MTFTFKTLSLLCLSLYIPVQTIAQEGPGIDINTSLNFNLVEINTTCEKVIEIYNPGKLTLKLEDVQLTGDSSFSVVMYSSGSADNRDTDGNTPGPSGVLLEIPPGKTGLVRIAFSPDRTGEVNCSLRLQHNATHGNSYTRDSKFITIHLNGTGKKTVKFQVTENDNPVPDVRIKILNLIEDTTNPEGIVEMTITVADIGINTDLRMEVIRDNHLILSEMLEITEDTFYPLKIDQPDVQILVDDIEIDTLKEISFQTGYLFQKKSKTIRIKNTGNFPLKDINVTIKEGNKHFTVHAVTQLPEMKTNEELQYRLDFTPAIKKRTGVISFHFGGFKALTYPLNGTWKVYNLPFSIGAYSLFIFPDSEWLKNREILCNQAGCEGFLEFQLFTWPLAVTLGTTVLSWQWSWHNTADAYQAQLISIFSVNSNILFDLSAVIKPISQWPVTFLPFAGINGSVFNIAYSSDDSTNDSSTFRHYKGQMLIALRIGLYMRLANFYISINYEDISQNLSLYPTAYTGIGVRISGGYYHE